MSNHYIVKQIDMKHLQASVKLFSNQALSVLKTLVICFHRFVVHNNNNNNWDCLMMRLFFVSEVKEKKMDSLTNTFPL